MPFNLLLLPLLGGYLFLHTAYFTRFRAAGLAKYRLVFDSALWGLAAALISLVVTRLAIWSHQLDPAISLWKKLAPYPYSGSALGALVLGWGAARLFNLFNDKDRSIERAVQKHGDELLQMLYEAQARGSMVMLSLESRKIYIGWVTLSPELRPDMPMVTILPMLSGYRDPDTLKVRYTDKYIDIYRGIRSGKPAFSKLETKSFQVVIPIRTVVAATPYTRYVPEELFSLPSKAKGRDLPNH